MISITMVCDLQHFERNQTQAWANRNNIAKFKQSSTFRTEAMRISTTTQPACLILLIIVTQTFNCEPTLAQSSAVAVPTPTSHSISDESKTSTIPNSITKQQIATEEILAQPIAQFGVNSNIEVEAAEFFKTLELKFFYDPNIEGIFDADTELTITAGVSLHRSLSNALAQYAITMAVESDGTIFLISTDDETEPDYLKTVTYDVSSFTNSKETTQKLVLCVEALVDSDSWEVNGGGNAVVATFELNGATLMSINNSYRNHLKIRSLLSNMQKLGGDVPGDANRALSKPENRPPSQDIDVEKEIESLFEQPQPGGIF